jgi:hypothetical protein
MKRILSIASTLAIVMVLLLSSTVSAVTQDWAATTVLAEVNPITIISVIPDIGTWDAVNNKWNVQFAGVGTARLTVKVRNNSIAGVTVNSVVGEVTPIPTAGTISKSWNNTSRYINPSTEFDFILTVSASADVPIISSPYYQISMSLNH